MSQSNLLRTIPTAWEEAIPFVTDALTNAGFQVVQSFDLQLARATLVACNCPHHGTDQCNCQYAVFLIYKNNLSPITLVAHGRDGKTEITLIESPEQRPSHEFSQQIQTALGRPLTESLRQELAAPMQDDRDKAVLFRLHSASGHLGAVVQMVEEGQPCEEIMHQLLAVQAAIKAAGHRLVKNQFEHSAKILLNSDCEDTRVNETERLLQLYKLTR